MDQFLGTFKWEKDENIDKAMDAVGAPDKFKSFMSKAHATRTLKDNGDGSYTMEITLPVKTVSHKFKLGEPFEIEVPMMDMKQKVTITLDGAKLVESREMLGLGKNFKVYFTREGDYVVLTIDAPGVTGKRYYKKQ